MSILGVGTDICNVNRIENALGKNANAFINRLLTKNEQNSAKNLSPAFIARRFASKEAVAKALGTGIGVKLSFQDFEIIRNGNEAPKVHMIKEDYKHITIHLSISDEKEYAVAFAIAEEN